MSSSFTGPNDSQAESENNFLASYSMEVEDDNVYIGRRTTDVSGNSGLDVTRRKILRFRLDGCVTFEVL